MERPAVEGEVPSIIYDAECAYCRRWASRFKKWGADRIELLPLQDERAVAMSGESVAELERAIHLVRPDSTVFKGANAVREILRYAAWGWLPRALFVYRGQCCWPIGCTHGWRSVVDGSDAAENIASSPWTRRGRRSSFRASDEEMDMIDADAVRKALRQVKDPEIGLNIIDLGLVYDVEMEEGNVHIKMTLTSPGCPVGPQIMEDVNQTARMLDGVTDVEVELVWEPFWTPERIDPKVRSFMGH